MAGDYIDHLKAVLRAPEDDAPRLAFSNFVERTDPDLAAFIQIQLENGKRERRPHARGLVQWKDDERRLLGNHKRRWTSLVAPYVTTGRDGLPACTFHRGFVEHVVVEPEAFIKDGDELLIRAPIHHVDFAPLRADVLPQLLACDALRELDSISFAGQGLDDAAVAAIAACPRLERLLWLDLGKNRLGPAAFEALAASPYLHQLLVVERAQQRGLDPALTYHPGEVTLAEISAERSSVELVDIRPEGHALEAKHGYLPWLHVDNHEARFDLRWFVDQRLRPVFSRGAAVAPRSGP